MSFMDKFMGGLVAGLPGGFQRQQYQDQQYDARMGRERIAEADKQAAIAKAEVAAEQKEAEAEDATFMESLLGAMRGEEIPPANQPPGGWFPGGDKPEPTYEYPMGVPTPEFENIAAGGNLDNFLRFMQVVPAMGGELFTQPEEPETVNMDEMAIVTQMMRGDFPAEGGSRAGFMPEDVLAFGEETGTDYSQEVEAFAGNPEMYGLFVPEPMEPSGGYSHGLRLGQNVMDGTMTMEEVRADLFAIEDPQYQQEAMNAFQQSKQFADPATGYRGGGGGGGRGRTTTTTGTGAPSADDVTWAQNVYNTLGPDGIRNLPAAELRRYLQITSGTQTSAAQRPAYFNESWDDFYSSQIADPTNRDTWETLKLTEREREAAVFNMWSEAEQPYADEWELESAYNNLSDIDRLLVDYSTMGMLPETAIASIEDSQGITLTDEQKAALTRMINANIESLEE